MKKFLIRIFLALLYSISSAAFCGGGTAHMLVAKEAVSKIANFEIQAVIKNNFDAYLAGSFYPDSGYVVGGYGEDSHWDKFIYTFADYIKKSYRDPIKENPKLLAFLFGCASHRVSDEIMHWTFYPISATHDFNGDGNAAHEYGDLGIDLLSLLDKNQWNNHPKSWWVPVKDLVNVYHLMGKDYKAEDIIKGNKIISIAGYGERAIAVPLYPFMLWRAPWTAINYYGWPIGGMVVDEFQIANYQLNVWHRIKFYASTTSQSTTTSFRNHDSNRLIKFALKAVETGLIEFEVQNYPDGSVEISQPLIRDIIEFQRLIDELIAEIRASL